MAKTKRTQGTALPHIRTEEQAKEILHELCEIQLRCDKLETEYQTKQLALRATYDEKMKDDKALAERHRIDMEAFFTYNRENLFPKDRKSIEYPYGTVDFRIHPPAVTPIKRLRMTLAACIEKVKEVFPSQTDELLRTKEELNKEVLVTLSDAELAKVGLEVTQKETFGIKLNLESIASPNTTETRNAVTV